MKIKEDLNRKKKEYDDMKGKKAIVQNFLHPKIIALLIGIIVGGLIGSYLGNQINFQYGTMIGSIVGGFVAFKYF